jgi:hypothetical protein
MQLLGACVSFLVLGRTWSRHAATISASASAGHALLQGDHRRYIEQIETADARNILCCLD